MYIMMSSRKFNIPNGAENIFLELQNYNFRKSCFLRHFDIKIFFSHISKNKYLHLLLCKKMNHSFKEICNIKKTQ